MMRALIAASSYVKILCQIGSLLHDKMAQNLLERERAKWAATQADVLSSLSTEQLASAVAEVDTKHVKAVAELDARQIRAMAELEAKQSAAAQLVQTQIAELRNENQAFRTRLERAVSEVDAKQSAAASLIQSLLAQIAELRRYYGAVYPGVKE
jgi:hypothetical protein